MRVLIACEFSGTVREAFARRGHDAWSCDLLPTEKAGNHFEQDIFTPDGEWNLPTDFDLMIAHPPCTHLSVSGARWFKEKQVEQRKAIWFFMALVNAPIHRIAVENPVSIMSTHYRKPDQVVQPWMFGHGETKATCFWLKNLPRLMPTHAVNDLFCRPEPTEREQRIYRLPPSPDRWKIRAKTFDGIAEAMAEQWGSIRASFRNELN